MMEPGKKEIDLVGLDGTLGKLSFCSRGREEEKTFVTGSRCLFFFFFFRGDIAFTKVFWSPGKGEEEAAAKSTVRLLALYCFVYTANANLQHFLFCLIFKFQEFEVGWTGQWQRRWRSSPPGNFSRCSCCRAGTWRRIQVIHEKHRKIQNLFCLSFMQSLSGPPRRAPAQKKPDSAASSKDGKDPAGGVGERLMLDKVRKKMLTADHSNNPPFLCRHDQSRRVEFSLGTPPAVKVLSLRASVKKVPKVERARPRVPRWRRKCRRYATDQHATQLIKRTPNDMTHASKNIFFFAPSKKFSLFDDCCDFTQALLNFDYNVDYVSLSGTMCGFGVFHIFALSLSMFPALAV